MSQNQVAPSTKPIADKYLKLIVDEVGVEWMRDHLTIVSQPVEYGRPGENVIVHATVGKGSARASRFSVSQFVPDHVVNNQADYESEFRRAIEICVNSIMNQGVMKADRLDALRQSFGARLRFLFTGS